MSRFHFTLAQWMAVVGLLAFGFAALRNADDFWASLTFSLAIVAVSVSITGACTRKEKARTSWLGFATTGGTYLVIWLVTSQTVGTLYGPPRSLLNKFQPYINPSASGGGAYIAYTQTSNSLNVLLFGLAGAVLSRLVTVTADRSKA